MLEHHVDPSRIKGTGKDGRLTKDDVLAAAKAQKTVPPAQAEARRRRRKPPPRRSAGSAALGPGLRRRASARKSASRCRGCARPSPRRLKEAQNTAAMLTTFNDVDMTAVIEARARYKDLFEKKHGIRLGFMGFFVKAVRARRARTCRRSTPASTATRSSITTISTSRSRCRRPRAWSSRSSATPTRMSFAEIEKTIADFGKRAKDGTLTIEDMQGGTFTISNGGVFGSLLSTPIINPPQSAVLGMHRIEERPVVKDGQIVARPMMYLALSPTTTA